MTVYARGHNAVQNEIIIAALGLASAVFGGNWIKELVRNRGRAQTRQSDELAKVREELRGEISGLRSEISELRKELIKFKVAYVRLREKVLTLIHLQRAQSPEAEAVAKEIEDDLIPEDEL